MDTRPIPGEPYSSLRSFIDAGGNPTELDGWETLGSDLVIDVGRNGPDRLRWYHQRMLARIERDGVEAVGPPRDDDTLEDRIDITVEPQDDQWVCAITGYEITGPAVVLSAREDLLEYPVKMSPAALVELLRADGFV